MASRHASEEGEALTSPGKVNALTPKKQAWIKAYLVRRNACQATIDVGITENRDSAKVIGHRILHEPAVAKEIERQLASLGDAVKMQSDPTLAALVEMRDFIPRRVLEAAGAESKALADQLSDEDLRCLQSISIKKWSPDGQGESIVLKPVNRAFICATLAKITLHKELTKVEKQETESEIKAQLKARLAALAAELFPEEAGPPLVVESREEATAD